MSVLIIRDKAIDTNVEPNLGTRASSVSLNFRLVSHLKPWGTCILATDYHVQMNFENLGNKRSPGDMMDG